MTGERSVAYGRVLKTLADIGPTKLHRHERDVLREAADTLLFCEDMSRDPTAVEALNDAMGVTEQLVESGRLLDSTAERVIREIEDCGPVAPVA